MIWIFFFFIRKKVIVRFAGKFSFFDLGTKDPEVLALYGSISNSVAALVFL